jgi:hypothetical protein
VRLRDWRVEGAGTGRALKLDFQGPASGEFEVTLELVPRTPLAATVTLPLPTPQGTPLPGSSFLAYRTQGLEAHDVPGGRLRVTGINAADFAPFWRAPSRPEPRSLAYACTFRREQGQPPVLRLLLRVPPAAVEAAQDVGLRVGPRQAEVRVTARLSAPGGDLSLVEWEVRSSRPLTVADVTGPDVRRWTRTGNRLLVWLQRTTGTTRVEVTGWLPLTPDGPAGEARLDLPCLRLVSARKQSTRLYITAGAGLSLTPSGLRQLWPAPDPRPSGQELGYVTEQPSYGGTCRVRPGDTAVRVLTFAEVRGRRLTFTAQVHYRVRRGELRTAHVRLRNWEGEKVELDAPGQVTRRERRRAPGDRTWTLELGPGVRGDYRLTLTGSMPVEDATAGVPMPDVTVSGAAGAERWLALAGGDLAAEAPSKLGRETGEALAARGWAWPAEQIRRSGGSAWRVTSPDWSLRLLPRDAAPAAPPVRVFLAEHSAAVADGGHWLHQVVYWLRHEAHTDLNVTLPAPARVVSVAVDGVEATPLQPAPERLWLPLPGGPGVRCVRLRWLEPDERLDRPDLGRPRLEGAAEDGPALWTAYVPAGWVAVGNAGALDLGTAATRAAAVALYRAAAQLRIAEALAGDPPGRGAAAQLSAAQKRFYLDWCHAERALEAGADRGAAGPEGQSLADWLHELQARNRELARSRGFEDVRAEAEHQARTGATYAAPPAGGAGAGRAPFPEQGTPLSWRAAPDAPAPRLRLDSLEGRETRAALAASGQWLGLLAAAWFLSLAPHLLARVRLFWPEQVAALGALGWYLAGPTAVVLGLLLLAAAGRLFYLGRGLRRLLPHHRAAPAPSQEQRSGVSAS